MNFLLNYRTLDYLAACMILGLLSIYLLTLEHKTLAFSLLTGYFVSQLTIPLGYFAYNSLLDNEKFNLAVYLVNLGLFSIPIFLLFAYNYPGNIHRKESRIIAPLFFLALVAGYINFVSHWNSKGAYFDFDIHMFYSYAEPEASRFSIPIAMLITVWAEGLLIRKILALSEYDGIFTRLLIKPAAQLSLPGLKHYTARFLVGWIKILKPKGKHARSVRAFAIAFPILSILPFLLVLVMQGLVTFETYHLIFPVGLSIVCFSYAIIYINNSPQPTRFMIKLVGAFLVLVTLLVPLLARIAFSSNEKLYDSNRLRQVEFVRASVAAHGLENLALPENIEYIATRPASSGLYSSQFNLLATREQDITLETLIRGDETAKRIDTRQRTERLVAVEGHTFDRAQELAVGQIDTESVPLMTRRYRYSDAGDIDTFLVYYNFVLDGKVYDVGFSYREYREFVHTATLQFVYLLLGVTVAALVLLPLFFLSNLINPLNTLLNGIKRVNEGDLDVIVPVLVQDEIGFLSHSFNGMVASIKNHTGHLEESVKARTAELQAEIVERQRAEDTLRVTAELNESIVNASPIGISIYNSAGNCIAANDAIGNMVGASKDQVLQQNYHHIGSWKESGLYAAAISAMQEKEKKRHEIAVTTTFEKVGNFDCHLVPISVANEPHLLFMLDDITERVQTEAVRQQAEEALKNSEAEYRSTLNNLLVGVVVHAGDTSILLSNPQAHNILGLTGEQMSGKKAVDPAWSFMHKDSTRMQVEDYPVARVISTREPLLNYILGINRPDREYVTWVNVNAIPILSENDKLDKVIINFIDITERIRAEAIRRQAEEQIEASLREKEVLLKEIHHRVKNNLAVISSLLSFQAEITPDERARAAFQESRNRVYAMARIHEHLYRSANMARIDMAQYVRGVAKHLTQSFGTHAIDLQTNVADVELDIDRATPCGLIINELISNALKHAFPPGCQVPESGPKVRVGLRLYDGQCELTVADNGVGLPDDLQIENVGRESLGLRLVNLLSRQLQGNLQVDRERGTTFCLTFAIPEERSENNDE